MPWTSSRNPKRDARRLQRAAAKFTPRVRRLARAEFREQRREILHRARGAADTEDLLRRVSEALDERAPEWQRFYRRVYATIGVEFALDGIPPGYEASDARSDDPGVGVSWGASDDPWWRETFRPRLGPESWWDPWLQETTRYADRVAAKNVTSVNATTKRKIRRAVRDSINQGEGITATIRRIDRLHLDQIIPRRSEVIARTETLNAARAGSHNATLATGLEDDIRKSWIATFDDRTRDEHLAAEAENEDIPFLEPFRVRNPATGVAEELMFPGDASLGAGAANLVQCRCDSVRRLVTERSILYARPRGRAVA